MGGEMKTFLFDTLHNGLGRVLDLRRSQHTLTVANLANADTPGYKAKVIPFDTVLSEAVGGSEGVALRQTSALHLDAAGMDPSRADVEEIEAPPWSVNGNSVVAERESMRLNENSVMYRAVAKGVSSRMALLRYAAADGKSG